MKKRPAERPVQADPAIIRMREEHGLITKVADELGITRSAVAQWKRVPPRHIVKVGKFLRIARRRINPDIYSAG